LRLARYVGLWNAEKRFLDFDQSRCITLRIDKKISNNHNHICIPNLVFVLLHTSSP
jgi:hypothetical protein